MQETSISIVFNTNVNIEYININTTSPSRLSKPNLKIAAASAEVCVSTYVFLDERKESTRRFDDKPGVLINRFFFVLSPFALFT